LRYRLGYDVWTRTMGAGAWTIYQGEMRMVRDVCEMVMAPDVRRPQPAPYLLMIRLKQVLNESVFNWSVHNAY